MTLTQEELSRKVAEILTVVKGNTVADGIDILAASLSAAIVSANNSGLFGRESLEPFFDELTARIGKTMKYLSMTKEKPIRIRRAE
jgi:hypothetical protein